MNDRWVELHQRPFAMLAYNINFLFTRYCNAEFDKHIRSFRVTDQNKHIAFLNRSHSISCNSLTFKNMLLVRFERSGKYPIRRELLTLCAQYFSNLLQVFLMSNTRGEKTIESRWYMTRRSPWNSISAGDTVWFKDAGEPVTAKAEVADVLQFENYSDADLKKILKKYGKQICFSSPETAFDWCKNKNYCILVFLKHPALVKLFEIDKKGFGNACAWISVENISRIKAKK